MEFLFRQSWLHLLLPLCFLRNFVSANDLKNIWDIQGPELKKCRNTGSDDDSICNHSSSAIRLDYIIHKRNKYAKYRIFQKECAEAFDAGTEPVRGSKMIPGRDNLFSLTLSPPTGDEDDKILASLEIRPTDDALTPSWWQRLTSNANQEQTIEFCIRMGLWLPPEAGGMEVNFRETNIALQYIKQDNGDGYVFNDSLIDPKVPRSVTVKLSASRSIEKEEDPAQITAGKEKDEL